MKISRICALVLLVIVGSAVAFADGINDPKVIVHGVNGNALCGQHNCQGVGVNFSFTIPKGGKGFLYFTNSSGKNWTSLALIVNAVGISPQDVNCAQTFFLSCTAKTLKNGFLEILLSGSKGGANPRTGILNGQNFTIGFSCNPACFPGGTTVNGHAGTGSSVPEPGTVALMVTGLGALISKRKSWRNRSLA